MTLCPANISELSTAFQQAAANPQSEPMPAIDLSAMNRLLEHKAEDMTATVQAGITLAQLQTELGRQGQWLPVDPPDPERLTISALLATNVSGPRRFGYGTVRDYVIGLQAVLANGRAIRSGGKVVKNVAGYDLMKLFIGSQGALGVVVEVTFKVLPLPETEQFVETRCKGLEAADRIIEQVLASPLVPIVLDLHNLTSAGREFTIVLGFAGTREDVQWQVMQVADLGFGQASSLDYQKQFFAENASFQKSSVLPSKLIEVIRPLGDTPFVARAGNGIIYHASRGTGAPTVTPSLNLEQRLKEEFDPKHLFPDLSPESQPQHLLQ